MKRNGFIMLIVLFLIGLAIFQTISSKRETAALPAGVGAQIGLEAPPLELPGLDGQTYKVGGKRDKPLLLNFWASWCEPCREEAPDLKRMYDQYKDHFDVYAVNVTVQDEVEAAKNMVKEFDFKFPILFDYQGRSMDMYKYKAIPTSFLINKEGTIVEIMHVVEPKALEARILELSK